MDIQLLLTGNELMTGDVVDSNSALIGAALTDRGYVINRKTTLSDDPVALRETIASLVSQADVLLINGGLGPTSDDLTVAVLAEACGVQIVEHPAALAHLEQWCARKSRPLDDANRKQALLPLGSEVIANPVGSAVGFCLLHGHCLVICTPGVPPELQAMLDTVLTRIQQHLAAPQGAQMVRLQTYGIAESTLQGLIDHEWPNWPEDITLSFRAGFPLLEVKLSIGDSAAQPLLHQCHQRLRELLADELIEQDLATDLVALLTAKGKTLTMAESCSGGAVAAMLTAVPGTSAVFKAGFVTYANAAKQAVLGVKQQTLAQYGAVSEAVVREMAQGALLASQSDYAIAISGIAGPGGGSADKPVGTVWVAWGEQSGIQAQRVHIDGNRTAIQQRVAAMGLDLIRRRVLGITKPPRYF